MPVKKFTIPPKSADKTCNTRLLKDGKEVYCQEKVENKTRCDFHNVGLKRRVKKEEARLETLLDSTTVAERTKNLAKDKRNLTQLDELVLTSLATIQELEKRYPISSRETADALEISRLRAQHAELVHKRVDLEVKLKVLMDANFVFDKAIELFEENVADTNTQRILLEGIGQILNECVASGNTHTVE